MNGKDIKWLSKKLDEQRDTQKEIFSKIDGLHNKIDKKHIEVLDRISDVDKCVASLQTEVRIKSGVWGTLGGAIPVGITIAIMAIKGFFTSNK